VRATVAAVRRLERLHAIVEHLRGRRTAATVAQLAARFGVTERTMFRDLAALRASEVPIEAEGGHGGGVRLSRAYNLPPLGLSIEEAVSLWLAVRLSTDVLDPTGPALATALDKVVAGIPSSHRDAFAGVIDRIVIGTPPWPSVVAKAGRIDPEVFRACERSVVRAHGLTIGYVDKRGAATRRYVEPHGLLVQAPVWYLLTVDRLRGAPRSFRLDRISSADDRDTDAFSPVDPRGLFPAIAHLRLER
jgi:predicted DNA-binding transcriptional regulator YafY